MMTCLPELSCGNGVVVRWHFSRALGSTLVIAIGMVVMVYYSPKSDQCDDLLASTSTALALLF
jgi:hypothetical protein